MNLYSGGGCVRARFLSSVAVAVGIIGVPSLAAAVTLSGTIHYSGARGPVSVARPILLYLWNTPSPQSEQRLVSKWHCVHVSVPEA